MDIAVCERTYTIEANRHILWQQKDRKTSWFSDLFIERFSLDCRKTKTKVNTLANQRA